MVWKHPHKPIIIKKANIASFPHFHICFQTFLAVPALLAGFTQKGLAITSPLLLVEKENAGLVLMNPYLK
jgi:hypothetical protein